MQAFPDMQALPVNNKMAEHCATANILALITMDRAAFYMHYHSRAASVFSLKGHIIIILLSCFQPCFNYGMARKSEAVVHAGKNLHSMLPSNQITKECNCAIS
jgi:acyl-CoA synthetase (NDP forming)